LRHVPKTHVQRHSRIYITSPVGGRRQADFLNVCAKIETNLSPIGLLIELKRIESSMGRRPSRRWSPRMADLDILFYGNVRLKNRILILPHPRAVKRRFVLAPLAEMCPAWIPPVRPQRSVRSWLEGLNDLSQNVKLYKARR
jgi:2-amino-4-hydroxy-6-hydroxymethyldihydropteridine diphosphokinase